jgi:ATP/maltotriose-dependent transcriptional regulator MalT
MMRAMLMENSGDAGGMLDNAGAALEGFRKVGDRWGMATTTAALALGRISAGDLDGSLAMFEESRRWLHELDATTDEAETLLRMASVHARAGRLDDAEALVDDAEDLVSQLGSAPFVLMCRCARGELARLRGDRDRARELLSEAVARMGDLPAGPPHLHVIMLVGLAHVELDEGDVAGARLVAEEAARLGRTTRDMPIVANVGVVVARLTAAEGDDEGAARLLGATRRLRGTDDPTLDDLVVLTAALRARMGEPAFAAAYESGTALTRDAALDLVDPR